MTADNQTNLKRCGHCYTHIVDGKRFSALDRLFETGLYMAPCATCNETAPPKIVLAHFPRNGRPNTGDVWHERKDNLAIESGADVLELEPSGNSNHALLRHLEYENLKSIRRTPCFNSRAKVRHAPGLVLIMGANGN